ncbi:hypothetical protein Tco_0168281 [Tanacetum coccineum]
MVVVVVYTLGMFLEIVDVFVRSKFEISSWRGARVEMLTYLHGCALIVAKRMAYSQSQERLGFVETTKAEWSCTVRVGSKGANLLWKASVLLGRKKGCVMDTLKFTAMPFGLTNAPAVFMELMSRSEEVYESHVKMTVESLKDEKMYVKFSNNVEAEQRGSYLDVEGIKWVMSRSWHCERAGRFRSIFDRDARFESMLGKGGSEQEHGEYSIRIMNERQNGDVVTVEVVRRSEPSRVREIDVRMIRSSLRKGCWWHKISVKAKNASTIIREVFVKLLLKSSGKLSIRHGLYETIVCYVVLADMIWIVVLERDRLKALVDC